MHNNDLKLKLIINQIKSISYISYPMRDPYIDPGIDRCDIKIKKEYKKDKDCFLDVVENYKKYMFIFVIMTNL